MDQIKIEYVKDKKYKSLPITGVWGGICPSGMIQCDFYLERPKLPEHAIVDVEPDKKEKKIKETPKEQNSYIREVLMGVTMEPHVARSIGLWLIKKADQQKELFSKKDNKNE